MNLDQLHQLTVKYIEKAKQYHSYLNQFFTNYWNGAITKEALRVLTREEIMKLKKMKEGLDEAHENWLKVIRN